MRALESFFQAVQKAALPGVWSKGVALSRENSVLEDSRDDEEIVLRIRLPNRPVSPKVSLWPRDEDWFCDCGDRNDPCLHIVAAVVALKNGTLAQSAAADGLPEVAPKKPPLTELHYRFLRRDGLLALERWIIRGEQEERLTQSLIRLIGGIGSGRITAPPVPATQDDFAVDQILQQSAHFPSSAAPPLDRATLLKLFPILKNCARIFLDGQPIRISSQRLVLRAKLLPENGGLRLSVNDPTGDSPNRRETFRNGAVLEPREEGGVLFAIEELHLSPQERELLSGKGRYFSAREIPFLSAEILPALQGRIEIDTSAATLPRRIACEPRILLKTEALGDESLSVTATLIYQTSRQTSGQTSGQASGQSPGSSPIAEVSFSPRGERETEYLSRLEVPIPDPEAEKALLMRLQSELHLRLNQPVRFNGQEALEFTRKARHWEMIGRGAEHFKIAAPLVPRIQTDGKSFSVHFESADAPNSHKFPSNSPKSADPAHVFQAWRENATLVPLIGGGYAPLPSDWLNRYGARILALASHQESRDPGTRKHSSPLLPAHFLPELADLCTEMGTEMGTGLGSDFPESLKKLKANLENHQGIPKAPLPSDLRAELRHYQQEGVNWLSFLRDAGMGAILADDMGLGKTLQALAAIRGRTLVVMPTSVLQSWAEQIERFRPGLSYRVYHGPTRHGPTRHGPTRSDEAFEGRFDVVLTSYGILRLEAEKICARDWDTVILDEAQTIKNPESQIAQAAHRLRGSFKIALSGTPVENRLEDLWSQLHFANPGLLGDRDEFKSDFIDPIARGDRGCSERLRKRIRPFILRRLKREVAPELPPRTEIVLHCELSGGEKDLYEAILASTRKEVVSRLETGGSIFAALEALLRLRQACCHPALVPGGIFSRDEGDPHSSAKLELLLQSLENSRSQGHRALIFSQWTSLLDRIEPALKKARNGAGISFSRLDGATRDRAEVVREFQSPDGPEVMLISLKAGGVGITLTAADHIYIMDPWWNPAAEDQAADRAHRIGQENPVLIHRLVAKDTVEDRILTLQKKKKELAEAVLGDAARAISLSREDILDLLK